MNEQWKDIRGYEGVYQVSSKGNVRSLDRIVRNKHGLRKRTGKSLKPTLYFGYPKVQLQRRSVFIHRLVAEGFLEKPEGENIVVNHINGIKADNDIENLEWCTQSKNVKHAYSSGLAVAHGFNKKLDDCQVFTILSCKNMSQRKIAEHYSLAQATVGSILKGKTYSYLTEGLL